MRVRHALTWLFLMVFAAAGSAHAELAPNPVEEGDFYFSGGIALYYYKTDDFEVHRVYADDDFGNTGFITDQNPRGFLFGFELNNSEVITPEVNFGYAFKKPLFKGALGSRTRLHFAAYGNKRTGSQFKATAGPPQNAFPLVNPGTGQVEFRDGWILFQPMDGNRFLENGDDALFLHPFSYENNVMEYRTYFGSGDMMLYFDEPSGLFQFSRGGGVTVAYENSQFAWGMSSPQLEGVVPGLIPAAWSYYAKMNTVYIGPRVGFSMGFEPVRTLSTYLAGSFAPMLAFSSITGTQTGMCLSACGLGFGSVGTVHVNETDINFAYDVRLEVGASIYLWVLRVSAQIGAFANNQFTIPREQEFGRHEAALADQWGYFGRAMATFSF